MEATKFDAWAVQDFNHSVAGKAKLRELLESGFSVRFVTEAELNAKFKNTDPKKRAKGELSGLVYIQKGE